MPIETCCHAGRNEPNWCRLVGKAPVVTSNVRPVTSIVTMREDCLPSPGQLAGLAVVRSVLGDKRIAASARQPDCGLNPLDAWKSPDCCCLRLRNGQRCCIL